VPVYLRARAAGDPLLGGQAAPLGFGIVLSSEAARRLDARPGQALTIALSREREGRSERAALPLTLTAVLPPAVSDSVSALAAPALLESIEAWRDGYGVPAVGDGTGNGPAPVRSVHALFRMHATSIREVEALAARLDGEGVATRTRAREIASTLGLQRNLRTVLSLVAAITVAGAVVALTALQLSTLRRKKRDHALLKLTGHGRAWLLALPVVNALAVALVGALLALVVYGAAAAAINTYFAAHLASGEAAVRLGFAEIAIGVAAATMMSVLPALWGGWRASNVEAADELREQ
jgi:putative ABC transport system permease protein